MNRLFASGTVFLAILAACAVHVRGPEPVLIPGGEVADIQLAGGLGVSGELLAVSANELVLGQEDRVVSVDLPRLRVVHLPRQKRTFHADWETELRPFCRYPKGLSEDQWKEILAAAGQERVLLLP